MKKEDFSSPVIHQYKYEIECWGRLLSFQKVEMAYFKNRLAEVIDSNADNDLLLIAEKFQEEFLGHEKVIDYLAEELKKQERLVEKEVYLDGEVFWQMRGEQKRLHREFKKGEELFNAVKNRFVQYLNELY